MASLQGLPSQLASMELKHNNKEPSGFEKLPTELRNKICRHLLKAENVRESPDNELVCHYKFETSILAVSKQIHKDTWPILYRENQVVVVSNNWDKILTVLNEYEVAPIASCKQKKIADFKNFVLYLRIHLLEALPEYDDSHPDGNGKKTFKEVKRFILVATELPRFVHMLRYLKNEAGLWLEFEFDFQIQNDANGPLSLATLKAVMQPFHLLGTFGNKGIRIEGIKDQEYANHTTDTISPRVKWLREIAWGSYELMVERVKVAEMAYRLAKWQKASIINQEAIQVMHNGCYHNPELNYETRAFKDGDFFETIDLAYTLLESNSMLIKVRSKEWDRVLVMTAKLDSPALPQMSSLVKGRMYLYRAIALAAKGRGRKARQQIDEAFKAEPADDVISDFATMVVDHSDKAATKAIFSDTSIAKFETLLPLQPAIMNPSEHTASERHVLHHFGYKGDYLQAIRDERSLSETEKASLISKAMLEREKRAAEAPGAPLRTTVLIGGETLWVESEVGLVTERRTTKLQN